MSITCSVCGTINPEGTKFCDGCGVELTQASAPAAAVAETPVASSEVLTSQPEAVSAAADTPLEMPPLEPVTPASDTVTNAPAESAPVSSAPLETPVMDTAPAAAPVASVPVEPSVPAIQPLDTSAPLEAVTPASEATPVAVPASTEPAPAPVAAAPVSSPSSSTGGEAKLGIKKYGSATGEFIPLQGDKLVVGRFDASSGPVDIDLSGLGGQEHISRRHAELYREGGVWKVRDLGSTNGVYVKRRGEANFSPRLQEPAELHDGDELAFGNLMLSFNQS